MKIINALKLILKYSAILFSLTKIIQFAIDELSTHTIFKDEQGK
jgi:hypothetical protein